MKYNTERQMTANHLEENHGAKERGHCIGRGIEGKNRPTDRGKGSPPS
jgi:hypothetical protein